MALLSRAFFRRRIISLATSLSVSATSFALADDPGHSHHLRTGVSDGNERQFLFASDLAISKMSRALLTAPSGNVDRDFVAVMIRRNEASIDMARAELQYGRNAVLRNLAQAILDRQQQEMSVMNGATGNTPSASKAAVQPVVPQTRGVSGHDAEPQDQLNFVNGNLAGR